MGRIECAVKQDVRLMATCDSCVQIVSVVAFQTVLNVTLLHILAVMVYKIIYSKKCRQVYVLTL